MRILATVSLIILTLSFEAFAKMEKDKDFQIGFNYLMGKNGKSIDCKQAEKFLLQSANKGNENAIGLLHGMYSGANIRCDENKHEASKWLHVAAFQGRRDMQATLAQSYQEGWYGIKNCEIALYWYNTAYDNGWTLVENKIESLREGGCNGDN